LEPFSRLRAFRLSHPAPALAGLALLAGVAAVEGMRLSDGATRDGAIAVVVLLAALASSVVGFAFSLLAGSALAFLRIEPVEAVTTMALCSMAIQSYAVWQLRASIRWRDLRPMLAAGALTTPLGVALLLHVDKRFHAALLGVVVISYAVATLLQRRMPVVRGTARRDALAGALGGLVGGISAAPGLFVTIWCSMHGWDKVQQRATYQPFILATQGVLLAVLAVAVPPQGHALRTLGFVPFALLGAVGGFALYRRLTTGQFQAAMSVLLIVSGAGLLMRAG
jgi:uncharacterized membrane protein YfcA